MAVSTRSELIDIPFPPRQRDVVADFVFACVVTHGLAIEWLRRKSAADKSVNTPVPELLYFVGHIREYSWGIASSDTGAVTFGWHFKMTSIWSPPLGSGVQSTLVSHLNRMLWL